MRKDYQVAVYYFNPNIQPKKEFIKRAKDTKDFCRSRKIEYIEPTYNSKVWQKFIKGTEKEPEKGQRCQLCFYLRLKKTASYAKKNNYKYFATTLTMGRQKNSLQVLQIGDKVEKEVKVKFLPVDFKKNYGAQISDWLADKMDFYKQNYCGCVFSRKR